MKFYLTSINNSDHFHQLMKIIEDCLNCKCFECRLSRASFTVSRKYLLLVSVYSICIRIVRFLRIWP